MTPLGMDAAQAAAHHKALQDVEAEAVGRGRCPKCDSPRHVDSVDTAGVTWCMCSACGNKFEKPEAQTAPETTGE